jgi:hypothetical protein
VRVPSSPQELQPLKVNLPLQHTQALKEFKCSSTSAATPQNDGVQRRHAFETIEQRRRSATGRKERTRDVISLGSVSILMRFLFAIALSYHEARGLFNNSGSTDSALLQTTTFCNISSSRVGGHFFNFGQCFPEPGHPETVGGALPESSIVVGTKQDLGFIILSQILFQAKRTGATRYTGHKVRKRASAVVIAMLPQRVPKRLRPKQLKCASLKCQPLFHER